MKVIYVAGPIQADTPVMMHEHILKAVKATRMILLLGAAPICVHPLAAYLQGDIPLRVYMPTDYELMKRSDAVFLLAGWKKSHCTILERGFAQKHGIPTFDDWELLEKWISESSTKNTR